MRLWFDRALTVLPGFPRARLAKERLAVERYRQSAAPPSRTAPTKQDEDATPQAPPRRATSKRANPSNDDGDDDRNEG